MKRKLLVAVPLLGVVALLAWLFRPKHESLGEAYVGERTITLWSSVAQVREQTGVLLYGDRVEVLSKADAQKLRLEAAVLKENPLVLQKIIADKLSDKVQIMMVPSDGKFFFTNDLVRGAMPAVAGAGNPAGSPPNQ